MKVNGKQWAGLVAMVLAAVLVIGGIVLWRQETILEQLQNEALAELERNVGQYDEQSIVLNNTSKARAEELAGLYGAELRITNNGRFATLTLPEGTTIRDVYAMEESLKYIEEMAADYHVHVSDLEEETEEDGERQPLRPDYTVTDTDYALQTYLDYLNMGDIWNYYTGSGITVAVIDTGIDTDHPEFAGRISEYSYNATEDKVVKDWLTEDGSYDWSLIEDEQGHGTSVTGVIAASMDGSGIVGIAPNVNIIVIKAECDENGTFLRSSDLVFGIYYAIERDVQVINMSFGGPVNASAEATQLAYDSDIICVAAAGNDSTSALSYPAADKNVIGVGALGDGWELADYSNYGENSDLVAPGTAYTAEMGGGYRYVRGTSLASPVVAAAVALYMQTDKYTTFDRVTEILYASCYDLGDLGNDWDYGFGALDISAFIREERGTITYNMLTDELDDQTGIYIQGHALQELPEPERLYAVFDGWYYDDTFTQEYNYYEDKFYGDEITLYAKWVNEDDGIPYTYVILDDGTVEIRSYTGHRRYITIPEKIEGRTVSSIGDFAFSGQTRLREVTLPSGLTHIGRYAFQKCANLVSIQIPEGVTTIGECAFESNTRLRTVAFTGSSKLETIGDFAFESCGKLEKIELPASLKSINGSAFFGATALYAIDVQQGNTAYQSKDGVLFDITGSALIAYPADWGTAYTLPQGVTQIGSCAFGFADLRSIDLSGVVTVGEYAFAYSSLESLVLPDTLIAMGKFAFYRNSNLSQLTIGRGLTTLAEDAFAGTSALTAVEIPNNILTLDSAVFFGSGLQTVTFEENSNLKIIGDMAFSGCAISEIDIPDSVLQIGTDAFCGNPLVRVGFGENSTLHTIGGGAFAWCWLLETIELPASLRTVGSFAFQSSGLTEVTVPAGVTALGSGAFAQCSALPAITVEAGNTVYHDLDGVVYTLDNTTIHTYPAGKQGSSYALQDTTQIVGPWAFAGTYNLTSVSLPDGLVQICEYGFVYASGLQSIQIPDNVLQIGRYAFAYDWNLKTVSFQETAKIPRLSYEAFAYCGITSFRVPANVSTMAQEVFVGCSNLTSITFAENSKLESISAYMFDGCTNLRTITFENGSALKSIQAHGLEGMDKLTTIDFGDAKVTNIDNFAFRFCESLSTLNLPDTVTNIGRYAFCGCKSLAELTIPENVEHIGSYAFLATKDVNLYFSSEILPQYLDENWDYDTKGYYTGVTSVVESGDYKYATLTSGNIAILEYLGSDTTVDLTKVELGGDITTIGGSAFEGSAVQTVVLPETLTQIQAEAFAHSSLKEISIPANVTFIGRSAFAHTDIETLTFAANAKLTVMEQYAFEGTEKLKSVTLPTSLTTMGTGVFLNSGLGSVTFAENIQITEIPQQAFANTKLKEVALPDSVTLVNHNAFNNVQTLEKVTFGDNDGIRLMSNAFYHTGLTSLNIPENVTYIGEYCFVALGNLTEFAVDTNNPNYTAVDGLLLTKSGRKLIAVPAGRTGSLTVPLSVEEIGFGAFEESKLSEVKFAENANILSLGYRAFFKANNITSITVPASVISIDYYAFAYCENLKEVIFAEGNQLKGIYEGAFCGDIRLESIVIPDTVVEISDFAFYGCSKIDGIPVSESAALKGIYDYAFAYTGIRGEFTTPESLIDIGNYAFLGSKLTSVTIPDTNKKDLLIGLGAFEDCNQLEEITLPFIGASYEDEKISWFGYIFGAGSYEANGTYIPESLKTVTITEGIQNIYEGAFFHASGLESIQIPSTVSAIHQWCFHDTTATYELTGEISIYWDGRPETLFNNAYHGYGLSGHLTPAAGITGIYISSCPGLTGVTIPDSVTRVSLARCGITEIYLPDSVTGMYFDGCTNLKSVRFPAGITEIPNQAFWGCESLVSLEIPETVTTIGAGAFRDCISLSNIVLPEGITTIEECTFYGCESLCSITLPSTLTTIEDNAFSRCFMLYEIINHSDLQLQFGSFDQGEIAYYAQWMVDRDGNRTYLAEDSDVVFVDTPEGFRFLLENGSYTLTSYIGNEDTITLPLEIQGQSYEISNFHGGKHIIIPEGMTVIGASAFQGHARLESITIPDSVTTIGGSAFANCYNLESVKLPAGVTTIGVCAFAGCYNLESVKLPAGLTTIAGNLFSNCRSLKEVVIPEGVTQIEWYAFCDCVSLESVSLPESLESIAFFAFGNANLTEIYIPANVFQLDATAFRGCPLESLELAPENTNFVQIGEVLYNADVTSFAFVPKTITHITIPATIQDIYNVFADCSELKSVDFESGSKLRDIGAYAFYNCTALESVQFPENVEVIGCGAFFDCTGLTDIVIPDSVTRIEDGAFRNSGLTKVTIPAGVTYVAQNAFYGCENLTQIDVDPANSSYRSVDGILYSKDMSQLLTLPGGLEGEIVIPEGVAVIPWGTFRDMKKVTGITLPDGLTTIEGDAFSNCTALEYVYIPDSVTTIGWGAFYECTSLRSVSLPAGLTRIEGYVFRGCTGLCSIEIPEGVEEIGDLAFASTNLYRVTIPSTVTLIEDNAFDSCGRLYEVYNNSDLEIQFGSTDNGWIAYYALVIVDKDGNRTYREDGTDTEVIFTEDDFVFLKENGSYTLVAYLGDSDTVTLPLTINGSDYTIYKFRGAKNVILPEGMTTIPYGAFWECTELKSIVIPDSVTCIDYFAFADSGLTQVNIPDSVTVINAAAFQDCSNLMEISVGDRITEIGSDVVYGTAYARNPDNWYEGALYLGRYLVDTREDIVYLKVREDTLVIANYAIDSDTLRYLEMNVFNDYIFRNCPNVETLVVGGDGWYIWDSPITLKNVIVNTDRVSVPPLMPNADVTFYMTGTEEELLWDNRNSDWNFENPIFYGDRWNWVNFYDEAGNLIQSQPLRSFAVVRLPYMEVVVEEYEFLGWDLDGDGIADSIPATTTVDIHAYAIYDRHVHTPGETVRENEDSYGSYDSVIYCAGCGAELSRERIVVVICGDVNGDGAVNNKDLVRLFQHLSDWDVTVCEPAMDTNGDGAVNNKDMTRLFQYLTGYDVVLGQPATAAQLMAEPDDKKRK